MARKLSDADVAAIREAVEHGVAQSEIAAQYGVSARHVGRIARGEARPQVAGLDQDILEGSNVLAAVERYLGDLDLDPADQVTAATARSLAAKLDQVGQADSAGAANAAPGIARELTAALSGLREQHHEHDWLDAMQERRQSRRLAQQAAAR